MYATGQLDDMNKVLVDVGTGYYVEMVSSLSTLRAVIHAVAFP